MLKSELYVQVSPNRFVVRNIADGRTVDRVAEKPFSRQGALLVNLLNAEAALKPMIAEAKSAFTFRIHVLMHPLKLPDADWTDVEQKAFRTIALGAGATTAKSWTGAPLTDAEVREKLRS